MRGTPRQLELAAQQRPARARQRAHRGAGVAEEQRRAFRWRFSGPPRPLMRSGVAVRARRRSRARAARRASPRVSSESSRSCTVVVPLGQRRPAAARGWRCSWSRAAGPCRRRPQRGRSRKGVENMVSPARRAAPSAAERDAPVPLAASIASSSSWASPRAHQRLERASGPRGRPATCSSTCSRLASRTSRHMVGSLAAMRVKSRKPGPASSRKSARRGAARPWR